MLNGGMGLDMDNMLALYHLSPKVGGIIVVDVCVVAFVALLCVVDIMLLSDSAGVGIVVGHCH